MKLVGSFTSPYVRKVRVALIEKQISHDFVNDPPWGADSHVTDYNPLGKVPALITDNGDVLFDSTILLEHIELLNAAPALLPSDKKAALQVKQLVILADGITDAGVSVLLESRRPPEKQSSDWVARQHAKIERGLAALDARVAGKTWLHGNMFSAADIAAGCMLFWLEFRLPQINWRKYPALADLSGRLAVRPSFVQTIPHD